MPSLYASQALTWLTTSPAAKQKFGSYFISKPTPGSLLGVRHPKHANTVVPLEGETPFVLAAVLWAANSGTFKNNMWAGPKDPQWPCPEANCAEFDLAAGPGLSKSEILRVWARRLALQIKLDTDAVFPWKIADLSADEFKMLFEFRPWMFSSVVPPSGILSSSARKEIIELTRETEVKMRFVASTSTANDTCATAKVKVVSRDRSSHSFWGFSNGRFDFGMIWDPNPLITYGLAISSSANHLAESKLYPASHPHILGIRCVTRLIQERDPVHPDKLVLVKPGYGDVIPIESSRRNACAVPDFRELRSFPLRAYFSKPVGGCSDWAYLLTSILRACNVPCYPFASRFMAMLGTWPTEQSSSCNLRKLVGKEYADTVASCLSMPSWNNFAVRWWKYPFVSAPTDDGYNPCTNPNNHHSVFCSSVGLQLCHADLLIGWQGSRYLNKAEDAWMSLSESLTIEVLIDAIVSNGLYKGDDSYGDATFATIVDAIHDVMESRTRKLAYACTLGFCHNALTRLASYHKYVVSRLQIWAYLHVSALDAASISTDLEISYLRFYLDAPSTWEHSDCMGKPITKPTWDRLNYPEYSASGLESWYIFFPRNYVTSNCAVRGYVSSAPTICGSEDLYTNIHGAPISNPQDFILPNLISYDPTARSAMDAFARNIVKFSGGG